MNGENNVESAVSCMKLGAADYLTRPLSGYKIVQSIKNIIENKRRTEKKTAGQEKEKETDLRKNHPAEQLTGLLDYLDKMINVDNLRTVPEEYRAMQERLQI